MVYTWKDYEQVKALLQESELTYTVEEYDIFIRELLEFMNL